jgi:hypothetical protein
VAAHRWVVTAGSRAVARGLPGDSGGQVGSGGRWRVGSRAAAREQPSDDSG